MITTLIKRVTYSSSKTEVWTLWHITVKKEKHHGKSGKNSTTNIRGHSSRFFTATSHQGGKVEQIPRTKKQNETHPCGVVNENGFDIFKHLAASDKKIIKIDVRVPPLFKGHSRISSVFFQNSVVSSLWWPKQWKVAPHPPIQTQKLTSFWKKNKIRNGFFNLFQANEFGGTPK